MTGNTISNGGGQSKTYDNSHSGRQWHNDINPTLHSCAAPRSVNYENTRGPCNRTRLLPLSFICILMRSSLVYRRFTLVGSVFTTRETSNFLRIILLIAMRENQAIHALCRGHQHKSSVQNGRSIIITYDRIVRGRRRSWQESEVTTTRASKTIGFQTRLTSTRL